jgi:transcriptional regulator with XRE-family HTH domain
MALDSKQAAQIKSFGVNLRRERMRKKITQEKLAELVDLNIRTVQKIEAGDVNILLTTVLRLRKALGCSWDVLMEMGANLKGENYGR